MGPANRKMPQPLAENAPGQGGWVAYQVGARLMAMFIAQALLALRSAQLSLAVGS